MEELQNVVRDAGLAVSKLPEKGRCLLTTKNFYPGEVILRQEPYVCVPNNSSTVSRCDGCFASESLKKCSACQVVWYCGSTCQKSEWKLHRLECNALSRLEKEKRKAVTPSIRLMVRLYLRRKLQNEMFIPTSVTDSYNFVEALVSHLKDLDEKQRVLYAQMANLVHLILQWPEINLKEIAENFSKLACNAHTICDCELRPLGTGLYPVVSIINHSCLPNAVLTFEGKSSVVRAIDHIPEGAEVSIAYIDTAGSTMTRQKALKEQYFFTCTCPRCIKVVPSWPKFIRMRQTHACGQHDDIQESAILEGYRCKDDRCNGFLLRDSEDKGFICQTCGLRRSKEEVKRIVCEITAISDKKLKSTSPGNHEEVISLYKMIEKLQMELCHPFSISLMRTREELLKILMELGDWREALAYCRLTITGYQRVYPELHPLLGLQYYTCGKIEWLLGYTEDAIKSLTRAVDILRITHGTSSPFMKELMTKLDEARAEASYNLSSKDE
ncbi:histone-lysine N-methyltransferase ASHR1 isoform X1 [Populus alba x Populus x berolinensis]|uniref:Histone-lysine N-methyltransferase ASHR1 isoform X1 n=1 Tax=Populus alba x Populus x berolinensis TaxID=444605 RepID=A0AAD6QWA0_9ROSI|nr:histone-lysine N-methyltransferase ASHR1 isoform X1 [Populus alba x Populus x berolinensis]